MNSLLDYGMEKTALGPILSLLGRGITKAAPTLWRGLRSGVRGGAKAMKRPMGAGIMPGSSAAPAYLTNAGMKGFRLGQAGQGLASHASQFATNHPNMINSSKWFGKQVGAGAALGLGMNWANGGGGGEEEMPQMYGGQMPQANIYGNPQSYYPVPSNLAQMYSLPPVDSNMYGYMSPATYQMNMAMR